MSYLDMNDARRHESKTAAIRYAQERGARVYEDQLTSDGTMALFMPTSDERLGLWLSEPVLFILAAVTQRTTTSYEWFSTYEVAP